MGAPLDLEVDARDRFPDFSIILFYLSLETGLFMVPANKAIPESL